MVISVLFPLLLALSPQERDSVGARNPAPVSDHALVLEIGGIFGRSLTDRTSSGGPSIAVEVTPIEEWLELEGGLAVLSTGRRHEIAFDLLFKKPWRVSRTLEFMAGIGPELSLHTGSGTHETTMGTEVVLDFMFWPRANVGWYLEPTYGFTGGRNGERSAGLTAGLLIGFP